MTFPEYVPTRQVTVGGAMGLESSRLLMIRVTTAASKSLIWDESGYRFVKWSLVEQSGLGTEVSMLLPRTDVAGWKDGLSGALIDVSAENSYTHQYTTLVEFLDDSGRPVGISPITLGPYVVPDGDGPIDLDKTVPASTVAGGLINVPDSWGTLVAAAQAAAAEAAANLAEGSEVFASLAQGEKADAALPAAQKGAASGVAPLDDGSRVPQVNLPAHLTPTALEGTIGAQFVERLSQYDIRDYGAKVDGHELTNASIGAATNILSSPSYSFTAADVGKVIGVEGAGVFSSDYSTNANDGKLISTITSTVAGNAILADNAVQAASGVVAVFGTADDDAVRDAQLAAVAGGGGTVFFPAGRTIVTRPLLVHDYISWAGVHRDVSWVEVIFSAPGTGPASAGQTDWLSCSGRSGANPLTGASFHDFGINARFHIRPGGYTAPIKVLNIFHVRRCAVYMMNVWNTGATSIPFDHQYEGVHILWNIIKNPGRLFNGSAGGSGIGIGTVNDGVAEPGLIMGNVIIGVGNASTSPRGNNGIFLEGQGGSNPATPTRGYRIIGNHISGMTNGISLQGDSGTIVADNILRENITQIRITDSSIGGAFPGVDALVQGNHLIDAVAPSVSSAQNGQGVLIVVNSDEDVKVRPRILDNTIDGAAGAGIRVSAGTNPIDQLEIRRNKIRRTGRAGIHLAGSGILNNAAISDNMISEYASLDASGYRHGLIIDVAMFSPAIKDNQIIGSANGIQLTANAVLTGKGIITGNDIPDVANAGSLAPTIRVLTNHGWVTTDPLSTVWIRPQDFFIRTGTPTIGHTNDYPFMSFDPDTTGAVSMIVPIPAGWGVLRVEAVWTAPAGASGNVTWRCNSATFGLSDPLTSAPAAGVDLPTAAPTDASTTITTLKTGIVGDKPFLALVISRIGGAGTDTSTAAARLLGIRLVRTS